MAKSLGNAYVSVVPRMTGFASTIKQEFSKAGVEGARSMKTKLKDGVYDAAKESGGAGKQAGQLFSRGFAAAMTVGNLAASALSSVVGGFGQMASAAMAASDSADKFADTLSFAGLGAEQIEELTKATQAYADSTVYEISDIRNVTAQLAANGVEGFDRLAQAAGNLNAVAGGNAETFSSVGMVLTQTAGAGKLTTENFNQLADAIPGASGVLQQELANMGAYTGNFRDAMAAGEITAEEFNQAILNLGMTEAAAEAATATDTFEGAFGNLEATLTGGLAAILTELKPTITDVANNVSEFLGPALQSVADKVPEMTAAFSDALPYIGAVAGAMAAYKAQLAISGAMQAVTSALNALKTAQGASTVAQAALNAVMSANPIGIVVTVLGTLVGAFATAWATSEEFREKVSNVFNTVKDTVFGAIDKIKGWLDFEWKWPHIPLPHFTFSGSLNPFEWAEKGTPEIGVKWYATGGILDGPQLVGVGEKGPEAIVPLYGQEMMPFARAIADNLAGMRSGGGDTYVVNIDGDALTADSRMIALLREFVAGAAEMRGRKVVFA